MSNNGEAAELQGAPKPAPKKPGVWYIVVVCALFSTAMLGNSFRSSADFIPWYVETAEVHQANSSANAWNFQVRGSSTYSMGIWINPTSASATCRVTTPTGDSLTVETVEGSFILYDFKQAARFTMTEPGRHTVHCTSSGDTFTYKLATATSHTEYLVYKYSGWPLMVGCGLAWVTMIVIGIWQERRYRKYNQQQQPLAS